MRPGARCDPEPDEFEYRTEMHVCMAVEQVEVAAAHYMYLAESLSAKPVVRQNTEHIAGIADGRSMPDVLVRRQHFEPLL